MTSIRSRDGVNHHPNPASRRARRVVRGVAFGFVGLFSVVACQANNTPPSYGDVSRASYLDTCMGRVPESEGTTTTLASSSFCECSYGVFVAKVPFNDDEKKKSQFDEYNKNSYAPTYVQFNQDLHDNPDKFKDMPQSVQDAVATCARENPTPPPGTPPGSTVGTTPRTTPGTTPGTSVISGPTGTTPGSNPPGTTSGP